MDATTTIKLKALFLLVSFSLNSVVGFACSLGLDMGFNSHHHHHDGEASHPHKHGPIQGHDNHHHKKDGPKHQHGAGEKQHHGNTVVFNAISDDNCCKDFVVGFQNVDKQVVGKIYPAKQKIEYTPFIFSVLILTSHQVDPNPVRTAPKILDHSPPPDIRVFIQSFQI